MYHHHKAGVRAELIAAEHLVQKGYYVFPVFGARGPIDLIALRVRPFRLYFLDVKAKRQRAAGWVHRSLTSVQKKLGVQLCVVDMDSRKVKIIARRAPQSSRRGQA